MMHKIVKVTPHTHSPHLECWFEGTIRRNVALNSLIAAFPQVALLHKLTDPATFSRVEIGTSGELFWKDLARMRDTNGEEIPCNFDIAPDFVYYHGV